MEDEAVPQFDPDLYAGTAEFYDRFRPSYPSEVIDELRTRIPLTTESRVVDLACGTGQIAFALAPIVGEVWAIDQEKGFIELGRLAAAKRGTTNIHWIQSSAETVQLDGSFTAITVANAFHRLDRRVVAQRVVPHLAPGGCLALVWSWSPWQGDQPWQRSLAELIDRWVDDTGARDRVPTAWKHAIEQTPHRDVLTDAGLTYEGRNEFSTREHWTVASLVGNVYSSSRLNKSVLGVRTAVFENEVAAALRPHAEHLIQEQTYAVEVARRLG